MRVLSSEPSRRTKLALKSSDRDQLEKCILKFFLKIMYGGVFTRERTRHASKSNLWNADASPDEERNTLNHAHRVCIENEEVSERKNNGDSPNFWLKNFVYTSGARELIFSTFWKKKAIWGKITTRQGNFYTEKRARHPLDYRKISAKKLNIGLIEAITLCISRWKTRTEKEFFFSVNRKSRERTRLFFFYVAWIRYWYAH